MLTSVIPVCQSGLIFGSHLRKMVSDVTPEPILDLKLFWEEPLSSARQLSGVNVV